MASNWTVPTVESEDWSKDSGILEKLMKGPLDDLEYVIEVEQLLKSMIKKNLFTLENLDTVWAAQYREYTGESEGEDSNKTTEVEDSNETTNTDQSFDEDSSEFISINQSEEKDSDDVTNVDENIGEDANKLINIDQSSDEDSNNVDEDEDKNEFINIDQSSVEDSNEIKNIDQSSDEDSNNEDEDADEFINIDQSSDEDWNEVSTIDEFENDDQDWCDHEDLHEDIALDQKGAVMQGVHYLIQELASDITTQQFDHLVKCIQRDWNSGKRNYELLRLAENLASVVNKNEPLLTHKILDLLWNCAHSFPSNIYVILDVFRNVLRCSSFKDAEKEKRYWLDKIVEKAKRNEDFVQPGLNLIIEICGLIGDQLNYPFPLRRFIPPQGSVYNKDDQLPAKVADIQLLQKDHNLIDWTCENLKSLMRKAKKNPKLQKGQYRDVIGHFSAVEIRILFLLFLLKSGRHWLSCRHAAIIWQCSVIDAVVPSVRDLGFEFMINAIQNEPLFHRSNIKDFFQKYVLKLDPSLLTECGIRCFRLFFEVVNGISSIQNREQDEDEDEIRTTILDNPDLIGGNYFSKIIKNSREGLAKTSMKMILEDQAKTGVDLKKVEKLLQCPVCFLRIGVPVNTCLRGHIVCENCRKDLRNCPVCRTEFHPNRQTVLNQLLELIPVSCKNFDNGCSFKTLIPEMINHELNCNYRLVNCVYCKKRDLVFCKLCDHFSKCHSTLRDSKNGDRFLSWRTLNIKSSLGNNLCSLMFITRIQAYFVIRCIVDWETCVAHICVHYIGKVEDVSKYMYEVKLDQGQGNFESNNCFYLFSGICLPYFESKNEVCNHPKASSIDLKKIFFQVENLTEFKISIRIKRAPFPIKKL